MKAAALLLSLALVGCDSAFIAGPSPSLLGLPVQAQAAEGMYRVVLELPSGTWRAGTPISGEARLEATRATSIGASGDGPIGFAYRELSGGRKMDPVWITDCQTYEIEVDSPIVSALKPSGGAGAGDPDEAFYLNFSRASDVRLPAGDWEISAVAWFNETVGCTGDTHQPRAAVRVEVVP